MAKEATEKAPRVLTGLLDNGDHVPLMEASVNGKRMLVQVSGAALPADKETRKPNLLTKALTVVALAGTISAAAEAVSYMPSDSGFVLDFRAQGYSEKGSLRYVVRLGNQDAIDKTLDLESPGNHKGQGKIAYWHNRDSSLTGFFPFEVRVGTPWGRFGYSDGEIQKLTP